MIEREVSRMKKTKRAAVVLACVLFFAMLFSVLFIAHESQHDCTGTDCSVCQKIEACENAVKNVLGTAAAASALAAVCFVFADLLLSAPVLCAAQTPVSLKVKLSD